MNSNYGPCATFECPQAPEYAVSYHGHGATYYVCSGHVPTDYAELRKLDTPVERFYGISTTGFSHATQPDPEIFNGWAPAACNRKLMISVEHNLDNEPVLAILGWPLFDEGERANVQLGWAPDCTRCRKIMGE